MSAEINSLVIPFSNGRVFQQVDGVLVQIVEVGMLEGILGLKTESKHYKMRGRGKERVESNAQTWPHRDTSCRIVLHHLLHQVNAVSLQGWEDL